VLTVPDRAGSDEHGSPAARLRHLTEHWYAHGVSEPRICLLIQLWCATDGDGTTIDVRSLARRVRKSPGTVQHHLRALRDAGHVIAESNGRQKTRRWLALKPAEDCRTCADRLESERAEVLADLAAYGLGPVDNFDDPAGTGANRARSRVAQDSAIVRDPESRVVLFPTDANAWACPWSVDDDDDLSYRPREAVP
jgi:DNA-binding transcriptional ArsR family regulator